MGIVCISKRWAAIVTFVLLLVDPEAMALNGKTPLADFHHDSWTGKDGAPGDVTCMAQSVDGWLWIGSSTGLYRFDGIRFTRFEPLEGEQLSRRPITAITAVRNGDLLVGYMDGTPSLIHDGHVQQYPSKVGKEGIGPVYNGIVDDEGIPWLATTRGLLQLKNGAWRNAGVAMGLPPGPAINLMLDQYGQVWTGYESGLFILDRSTERFRLVMQGPKVVNLNESPDGRLWLDTHDKLISVPPQHQGPDRPRPTWLSQSISQENGLFDRNGNYWSLMCPVGVCLTAGVASWPGKELKPVGSADSILNQSWQLSSLAGNVLFEDRDGNIWVGTQKGLDRFRDNRLTAVKLKGGERGVRLTTDESGGAWALGYPGNTLWKLTSDGNGQLQETLPKLEFGTMSRGKDGALLIARSEGIERRLRDHVERIAYPDENASNAELLVSRLLDDGQSLWVTIASRGTFFRRDGKWANMTSLGLPRNLFFASPGKTGAMWLGFVDGLVVHYDNGSITRYPDTPVGAITFLAENDSVVAGGDVGLAVLVGQHFRLLKTSDPDALTSVTGMVIQPNGDHWLHSRQGVVLVRGADWAAALANEELPVKYTIYGALDGFTGTGIGTGRVATAVGDASGQLWFANSSGILHFDTTHGPQPQLPPAPKIESLTVQDRHYRSFTAPLQLSPGTAAFRIEYTALSYARPELLKFRYQLTGVDSGWVEAGSRRAISYNNLGPGDYRFRVAATDDLGQDSVESAEIAIRILPTFRQTPWFVGLCALAAASALYLLYLMRLKQAMRRLSERLAERERIARTLHDSFLQSVQGLILSFYTVVTELPGESPGRRKMERVLALAERVMEEGRDEVHELRSNAVIDGDVGRALNFVGEVLQDSCDSVFSLRQQGESITLSDDAANEIYRVGREALVNAFRHSGAKSICVQLEFGDDQFKLRVIDDGCGITQEILSQGRDGHWGLPGMSERAARIDGQLNIDSTSKVGTRVELVVPAANAYGRKPRRIWRFRWP